MSLHQKSLFFPCRFESLDWWGSLGVDTAACESLGSIEKGLGPFASTGTGDEPGNCQFSWNSVQLNLNVTWSCQQNLGFLVRRPNYGNPGGDALCAGPGSAPAARRIHQWQYKDGPRGPKKIPSPASRPQPSPQPALPPASAAPADAPSPSKAAGPAGPPPPQTAARKWCR